MGSSSQAECKQCSKHLSSGKTQGRDREYFPGTLGFPYCPHTGKHLSFLQVMKQKIKSPLLTQSSLQSLALPGSSLIYLCLFQVYCEPQEFCISQPSQSFLTFPGRAGGSDLETPGSSGHISSKIP